MSTLTKDEIRTVLMEHGFTIKEGQTDLKPYVYEAAEALLAAADRSNHDVHCRLLKLMDGQASINDLITRNLQTLSERVSELETYKKANERAVSAAWNQVPFGGRRG